MVELTCAGWRKKMQSKKGRSNAAQDTISQDRSSSSQRHRRVSRMQEALQLRRELSRENSFGSYGYLVHRKSSLVEKQTVSQFADTSEDDDSDPGHGECNDVGMCNKSKLMIEQKSQSLLQRSALIARVTKPDCAGNEREMSSGCRCSAVCARAEDTGKNVRSPQKIGGLSRMQEALRLRNEPSSDNQRELQSFHYNPDSSFVWNQDSPQCSMLIDGDRSQGENRLFYNGVAWKQSFWNEKGGDSPIAEYTSLGETKPLAIGTDRIDSFRPATRLNAKEKNHSALSPMTGTNSSRQGTGTSRMQEALRLRRESLSDDSSRSTGSITRQKLSPLNQEGNSQFADISEDDFSGDECLLSNYGSQGDPGLASEITGSRRLSPRSALVAILTNSRDKSVAAEQPSDKIHVKRERTRAFAPRTKSGMI